MACHENQIATVDIQLPAGAAKIRAEGAREEAAQAIRRPIAPRPRRGRSAWRIWRPAQPSPTIAQCLNGGYGWLQVQCRRCETEASIPLEHVRRPRDTPIWKLEAALKCRSCRTPRYSPGAYDPAHRRTADRALCLGAPGRR